MCVVLSPLPLTGCVAHHWRFLGSFLPTFPQQSHQQSINAHTDPVCIDTETQKQEGPFRSWVWYVGPHRDLEFHTEKLEVAIIFCKTGQTSRALGIIQQDLDEVL